jgi:hypothetical protein
MFTAKHMFQAALPGDWAMLSRNGQAAFTIGK